MRGWLVPCVALAFTVSVGAFQDSTGPAGSPARPPSAAQDYVFPSGAGFLLFHVRIERVQDFEAVVDRLAKVLDATGDEGRRLQAASWKIFRSVDAPKDEVIYVFAFDPAVAGADYDPVKVLSEAAPAEVAALYERLRASVIRVERMGLMRLR